jgi:hypothetical protein
MILEVIDVEESFLELLRFGIPSGGFPVSALQVLMRLRLLLFQGGAALCFPSSSRRLLGNGVHRGVPGGLSFFQQLQGCPISIFSVSTDSPTQLYVNM